MTDVTPARGTEAKRSAFRPEIQALRALAVLGVVLNHFWPERLHGGFVGVDIFFVISGYLITSHLLREVDRTGRIRLAEFWARRARRLLPASLLVLAVSAVAAWLVIPQSQWLVVFKQIAASALYVQNWALASDAVDYFASANSASPVTHYWSLSAEEQFYIVWPLLILLAVVLTRGRAVARRRAVIGILAVVTVASLAYSIYLTAVSPSAAYFVTPVRAWEFGVGGLLAASGLALPAHRGLRVAVAWAGWIALLGATLLFTETLPFPGWIALLPVLGTAAVILAGDDQHAWAPGRITSFGPIQLIGDISYSLYLWHWPLIIIAPFVLREDLSWKPKVVLLALSLLLAWLSKRFIEDPARQWTGLTAHRARRTLLTALVAMVLIVAPSVATMAVTQQRTDTAVAQAREKSGADIACYGAAAVAPGADCDAGRAITSTDATLLNAITQGNPVERGNSCQQDRDIDAILECDFGVPAKDAKLRLVMTGDSHMGHWTGALDRLATERGWNVRVMLKSSCAVTADADIEAGFYPLGAESCRTWSKDVIRTIADDPDVDVVVTSAISREFVDARSDGTVSRDGVADGFEAAWRTWLDAGKKVVVLADVPTMSVGDVPNCVARAGVGAEDPCTVDAQTGLHAVEDPMITAGERIDSPDFELIDLTSFFCDTELCHSVAGTVIMYGDANHISNSYSRTLAPYVGGGFDALLKR